MDINRKLRIQSSKMWNEFKTSSPYLDIVDEITERREGLIDDLVRGEDPSINTDGELRKRIQELEWIIKLVDSIIEECEAAEKSRETNISDDKENEDGIETE